MSFFANLLRSGAAEMGIEPKDGAVDDTPKPKGKGKAPARGGSNAETDESLFGRGGHSPPDSPTMQAFGLRGGPSNLRKTPESSHTQPSTTNPSKGGPSKTSAPGTSGTSAQATGSPSPAGIPITISPERLARAAAYFLAHSQKQDQQSTVASEQSDTQEMIPADVLETLREIMPGSSGTQPGPSPAPHPSPGQPGDTLAQIRAEANRTASSSAEIVANRLATQFAGQAEAAAESAAARVAHQFMEQIKILQAGNESRGVKRAEPPSPVDPTKARETARVVKTRPVETKKLQDVFHKRVDGYWEDKGELGPPVPAILAQRVRAAYADGTRNMPTRRKALFRFPNLDMLGDNFKIADLAVDTSTGPKSDGGWNIFMAQYFAADFVREHSQWTKAEVERAFFTWLQGLREKRLAGARRVDKAAALNITAAEVKRQEDAEHAAAQVRATLYFRRLLAAQRLPASVDPQRFLEKLIIALDKDGMSDNEVEITEQNVQVNYRTRPEWRGPPVRVHMSNLDAVGDGMRLAHPHNHGGRPQPRLLDASREPRVNRKSKPVPGLWRNVYDQTWLAQQPEEWVKYQLCPREEDFPSQFDATLTEFILSFRS